MKTLHLIDRDILLARLSDPGYATPEQIISGLGVLTVRISKSFEFMVHCKEESQ
jgi:hypothetical protein